MAPLAETTALYEAITAGDLRPAPAAVRQPAGGTVLRSLPAHRVATRSWSGCWPPSVPVGSWWSRVSRGWARPASSRRSSPGSRRPAAMARCYDNDGDVPYGPLVDLLRLAAAEPTIARRRSPTLPRTGRDRGGAPRARARTGRGGRRSRRTGPAPTPGSSTASPAPCGGRRGAPPGLARPRRRPLGRRRHPAGARPPGAPGGERRAVPDRHPAQRRGRRRRPARPSARRPAPRRRGGRHPARPAVAGVRRRAGRRSGAGRRRGPRDRRGDPRERGPAVPGRRVPRRAGGRAARPPTSATCSAAAWRR